MSRGRAARLAIRKYSEALRLCPDHADALASRASARHLSRPFWLNLLFGAGRHAAQDARQALACADNDPKLTVSASLSLPRGERLPVLRTALEKAPADHRIRLVLWQRIAQEHWHAHDFEACARVVEAMLREDPPLPDPLGTTRQLLAWSYQGLGRYEDAVSTYRNVLAAEFGGDASSVSAATGLSAAEVAKAIPDLGQLASDLQLRCVAGVSRNLMRSERFDEALTAIEHWRDIIPEERVPINIAAIEALRGGTPGDVDKLLPEAAAYARESNYYQFLAGVLFTSAGYPREARAHLRRFVKMSQRQVCLWGKKEAWERARAKQIMAEL